MQVPQQVVEAGVTGVLSALCYWLYRVEGRREDAHHALAVASAPARLKRAAGDLAPGPALLRVQVAGAEGAWINLGTSHESFESLSASPTLKAAEFDVATEDGRPLALAAGTPLEIQMVDGARRNVLESITERGGVVHVFSFEVRAGTSLWLQGLLPDAAAPGTPFREGATRRIEPMGNAYVLRGVEPGEPVPSSGSGCWMVLLVVMLLGSTVPILAGWDEAWAGVTAVAVGLGLFGVWLLPKRAEA